MRARSTGDSSGSVSGLPSRHAFTQLPNVPSLTPRSRATSAIGLPVSITSCTASALNCGLNFRRVSGMNRSSQLRVPVQDRWYTPVGGQVLVGDGAQHMGAAVPPAMVVEVVAPGQHDSPGMIRVEQLVAGQDLPLQGGEERLRGGIVETRSDPAHGLTNA